MGLVHTRPAALSEIEPHVAHSPQLIEQIYPKKKNWAGSTHEYALCRRATNTEKCMPPALQRISKVQKWRLQEFSILPRSQWHQDQSYKKMAYLASSRCLSSPTTVIFPSSCHGTLLPSPSRPHHLQLLSI